VGQCRSLKVASGASKVIDSHCHFDFEVFDSHRSKILQQCVELGIDGMVVPAVEPAQWHRLIELQGRHTSDCRLWIALGVHPWWQGSVTLNETEFKSQLRNQLEHSSAIAIGECGLDGSIDASIDSQQPMFEWQLQLACELHKPLIVHAHRAHNQVMSLLARYRPPAGGVIHGFSGSVELAQQYWRLGFYIGVGGTITYSRAQKTRQAITQLPLESLLLETDAPDMPLQGYQGQTNSPIRLAQVAAKLAQLKGVSESEVKSATAENTRRLFSLS
jgi:TatD DNase family protein